MDARRDRRRLLLALGALFAGAWALLGGLELLALAGGLVARPPAGLLLLVAPIAGLAGGVLLLAGALLLAVGIAAVRRLSGRRPRGASAMLGQDPPD